MKKLNFMKFRPLFIIISTLLIGISIYSIINWRFKPSIDFVGGTVWEIESQLSKEKIESILKNNDLTINSIINKNNNYIIKFNNIDHDTHQKLFKEIKAEDEKIEELRFESLGPILGKELLKKTIYAIILSSLALLLFIGSKFKDWTFGLAAILANFHDTFILIGMFSLLGHFMGAELDALFVTALLTTLSSSVHDTVVTFDRIRELKHQNIKIEWTDLANNALTETIVRSVNNSMTIIFMLSSLVILGGNTTRWFATALLIGCVCGTYSSFGVAIPLVLFFKKLQKRRSVI